MTKHLEGTPYTLKCWVEKWVSSRPYFELIHDGSKTDSLCYTKVYALLHKGVRTGVGVKFVYDYRTNLADVEIDDEVVLLKKNIDKSCGKQTDEQILADVMKDSKAGIKK